MKPRPPLGTLSFFFSRSPRSRRPPRPALRSPRTPLLAAAALSAVLSLLASGAAAQPAPSAQDIALAEKAFEEGIALAQAGNCKEAIVKLELSQKIDPASGTALNLGKCYEMLGRTASAYGAYSQSAGLARVKVNEKIRGEAEERMKALAPGLSNLEFRTAMQAAAPEGLTIAIDGKPIAAGALGVALPVDPGEREIEVTAPGKKAWKTRVMVAAKAGTTAVEIPALETAPVVGNAPASEPPRAGMSGGAMAATIGLAGVGVVALGVGVGLGVDSMDKNAASKKLCLPADETMCSAAGVDLRNQAFGAATASNVAFGIGAGALVAAGGVLLVSRFVGGGAGPKKEAGVTAVGIGPGGVSVRGQW